MSEILSIFSPLSTAEYVKRQDINSWIRDTLFKLTSIESWCLYGVDISWLGMGFQKTIYYTKYIVLKIYNEYELEIKWLYPKIPIRKAHFR